MADASNTVTVVIGAEDKFTDVVNKFNAALKDAGEKSKTSMQKATDASKDFAIGLAAVGTAVVGFGVLAVHEAEAQNMINQQTQAVIKSTAGVAGVTSEAVQQLGDALSTTTNFSKETVQSTENLLLTFTSIGKDIFPQVTTTTLDMAQALGEDTKSAAIQLGKALQDPVLGITALRRVGVNFTDDQKNVIDALVKTGKSAEAQKIILAELNREFGGSAKAVADPMVEIQHALEEVTVAFGQLLLPAVLAAANAFIGLMNSMGGAQGIVQTVTGFFQRLAPFFPIISGMLIGALTPAFLALGTTILTVTIPAIITAIAALAPFIIVGALIGAAATLLYMVWTNNMLGIRDKTMGFLGDVKKFWDTWSPIFFGAFKKLWTDISAAFMLFVDVFTGNWSGAWTNVKTLFGAAGADLLAAWNGLWSSIGTFLKDKLDAMLGWFKSWYDTISGWITGLLTAVGLVQKNASNVSPQTNKAPGHAFGGRVDGPAGLDNILTPLSAGEIVLNAAQQQSVASNVQQGRGGQQILISFEGAQFNGVDENFATMLGDKIMRSLMPNVRYPSY